MKFQKQLANHLIDKFSSIEKEDFKYKLDEYSLESNLLSDEKYMDRLNRVKSFRSVKLDGIEGKTMVVRIDLQESDLLYDEIKREDGSVDRILKEVGGSSGRNIKETIFCSTFNLLENRAKYVILLIDYGPKHGKFDQNYSLKQLHEYLVKVLICFFMFFTFIINYYLIIGVSI